jgi:hypothetical protein
MTRKSPIHPFNKYLMSKLTFDQRLRQAGAFIEQILPWLNVYPEKRLNALQVWVHE